MMGRSRIVAEETGSRHPRGWLAAAVVACATVAGVHCGGAVGLDDESVGMTDDTVDTAAGGDRAAATIEAPSNAPVYMPRSKPSPVLASVDGEEGTRFVTGQFTGTIRLGDFVLRSRGKSDVFLARVDAEGTYVWARGIGGLGDERAPDVRIADGGIVLLGLTDGEIDCGTGSVGMWNSPMFFYCKFDDAGATLAAASFPTGAH